MTSLRYYTDPRIVKLDKRFKGYNRGFRYRVDFKIGPRHKASNVSDELWERWRTVVDCLETSYGKEYTWNGEGAFIRRIWNDDYRIEIAKNKWYRHLYLRDESAITMLLLVIS